MCNNYYGYTNYPTWNISLWIGSDQKLYSQIENMAIDACNDTQDKINAIYLLGEQLKELFNECNPLANNTGIFSDLLGWALDNVNWYELAEHWIENVI